MIDIYNVQRHIKYAWLLDKENGILNYFLIVEKVSNYIYIYIYIIYVHEPFFISFVNLIEF